MQSTTKRIVDLLLERRERIGLAESCTGGALSQSFTRIAGVSAVFYEGLVTYATASKVKRLGLDPGFIERYGVVSIEVAGAMAAAMRQSGVAASLATTGIAGPNGGTETTPLGCVCIAASYRDKSISERHQFNFVSREQVIDDACHQALKLLFNLLNANISP